MCLLMVIHDLHVIRSLPPLILPDEADAVLIVDADAVLSGSMSAQLLQPPAGQAGQIVQRLRSMQTCQLHACPLKQVGRQTVSRGFGATAVIDVLRRSIAEAANSHETTLYHMVG